MCAKVFEGIIYNTRDSWINQLLLVTHDIYKSFDDRFEGKSVFLDICKVFNRIWHEGLIYQIQTKLNFRKTFECNERLRQFENKKSGTYRAILFLNKYYHSPASCVKFRTIFLFNYISNASKDLSSKSKLSADEASPFLVALGINNSSSLLNEDLRKTNDFAAQWKMVFNLNPTKAQKKILSGKIKMPFHHQLRFNNTYVNVNWESIYKDHFVRFFC